MLHHKDYVGVAEYDDGGKIFTGEVIGVRDVITFQGRSPDELEQSFRDSIDFYLEMCERDGVEPDKAYSGKFNLRVDPDLHRKIAMAATTDGTSLNQWVSEVLEKATNTLIPLALVIIVNGGQVLIT